jgi:hypothetical protein
VALVLGSKLRTKPPLSNSGGHRLNDVRADESSHGASGPKSMKPRVDAPDPDRPPGHRPPVASDYLAAPGVAGDR